VCFTSFAWVNRHEQLHKHINTFVKMFATAHVWTADNASQRIKTEFIMKVRS